MTSLGRRLPATLFSRNREGAVARREGSVLPWGRSCCLVRHRAGLEHLDQVENPYQSISSIMRRRVPSNRRDVVDERPSPLNVSLVVDEPIAQHRFAADITGRPATALGLPPGEWRGVWYACGGSETPRRSQSRRNDVRWIMRSRVWQTRSISGSERPSWKGRAIDRPAARSATGKAPSA